VVDENPPHRLCGDGKEMGAVSEGDGLRTQHAQAELVDQRVRFECVIGALMVKETRGDLLQLRMHNRKQPVTGGVVTVPPVAEPSRDLLRKRCGFHRAADDTGEQTTSPAGV
jgi:hypothetical protein